ncbi:C40 family peptidase [Streptosporangiaceae bacterium NEAU-GS5]|nr:C40 family peptidase [Streptosporangiaceae bacterium NEAU-GS5]
MPVRGASKSMSIVRILDEVRRDLSHRPRLPRPPRFGLRRTVPALAFLVAVVIAVDLVVWGDLEDREQRSAATVGAVEGPHGRFVAAGPATTPQVAALKTVHRPHLFVVARAAIPGEILARVLATKGVAGAEMVDAAEVTLDGKKVATMGVAPSTFRAFTPKSTARSDALWANVAAGDVAVSFDLGNDGGLALGSTVSGGGRPLRVGAYATMGIGSIAAVVSHETAAALGIPAGNAMVISAPKLDAGKLRKALLKVLPKGSQVAMINPVAPVGRTAWPQTAFMSLPQLRQALTAAAGKLGRPYVWGAEGPDYFDCSGLVQWAYAQAGVRMPRVAAQQWASGLEVPLSQAQPGDLLFWRNDPTNPGYISHVAIYWGGGKMLHAPHTGDVVRIASIYTKNLAGVVRVSPQVAAQVR